MKSNSLNELPIVIIACKVFQDIFNHYLPEELAHRVIYKDYGLHKIPKKIMNVLQSEIDSIKEPSLVVLGYGLCGNGLSGVKSGIHTLLIPCVDDCIAVLLGSHQAYIREFEAVPGTYYLSKGWLESGSHPLQEYDECVAKYGSDNADYIMDQQYQHYRRVVLVAHNQQDLEAYRAQAQEVASFCQRWDMSYEEILGSDNYIRLLIEVMLDPDKANEDFVLIEPGGQVRLEQFLR
jgi:hypothetical protein